MENNKAEEKVEIIINETEEVESPKIKETSFSINTAQSGTAEFISEHINGELLAVIIESPKQIDIDISLEMYENVVLFNSVGFVGQKYLPLTAMPVDRDNLVLHNEHVSWSLNDRLRVKVNGPLNSMVNVIVRWC